MVSASRVGPLGSRAKPQIPVQVCGRLLCLFGTVTTAPTFADPDVDFADLIKYFGENQECDSIVLYMESLTNARSFVTAARAFARSKPILVYKAGRFAESAAAADSHTGAMTGEDAVYQTAFERAGGLVR